jgi:transcriptional regulator with XRE-family HTH domain
MSHTYIAEQLLYQRKLKGLSQEQLAERTNVTVRTIQRIEKGEVTPHLRTVKLLAAVLDIEIDDLLQLTTPTPSEAHAAELKWLLLMHTSPFLGFVPLLNIIAPLLLWSYKRGDKPEYDTHGRTVVNFQITATLLFMLSLVALVTVQGWGFLFFMSVIPLVVTTMLINIITVLQSQKFFYPAIPFLRSS